METKQILALIQEHNEKNEKSTVKLWKLVEEIGRKVFKNSPFTKEDKEDIIRDKVIKLIYECNLPQNESVYYFITRSFKNQLVDELRNKKRFPTQSIDEVIYSSEDGDEITLKDTLQSDIQTDDDLRSEEVRDLVLNCISGFGAIQKPVVTLYLFEELNNSEIAKRLGLKMSQVESAKFFALKKIREFLKKYFSSRGSI
ncbi:MAG: hypothetical protein RLZ10_734 [Bacteroidota bacterium]|jgi:RNA polymerase sigma factor (sigma-70 family)